MMSRRWRWPSWWAWLLLVAGVALFLRLGVWQLDRSHEKQAQLDAAAAVIAKREAVPLASAPFDAPRESALDWAAGAGRFVDAAPVLLDDQIRAGRVGVHAYRRFQPEGAAGELLVDVGWLPLPANRALPAVPVPDGMVEVRGLLAPPPSAGLALGPGVTRQGEAWLAMRIEPARLAQVLAPANAAPLNLAPRVLRLDPALPFGFTRDLDVLPNTLPPARHLGYAVQWFAFAIAALVIFVLLHSGKVKK